MAKFYRVIKDHPMWEVGAIINNEDDSERYSAISDLWLKDIKGMDEGYEEYSGIVENQPEWFERVYKVNILKQAKYLTKAAARKFHDEIYKGDSSHEDTTN